MFQLYQARERERVNEKRERNKYRNSKEKIEKKTTSRIRMSEKQNKTKWAAVISINRLFVYLLETEGK